MNDRSHDKTDHDEHVCSNCGEPLHGRFCFACGQKDEPLRQPVRHFVKEASLELLGIDGRLWRSLGFLIAHPGRLTRDYLRGQRAHYIRPLRLYFTTSLIFFFLFALGGPINESGTIPEAASPDSTLTAEAYLAWLDTRIELASDRFAVRATELDSLVALQSRRTPTERSDDANSDPESDSLQATPAGMTDVDWAIQLARNQLRVEDQRLLWIRNQITQARPDSLVSPADYRTASEVLFDAAGTSGINFDLPEWWPQSETVRRIQTAQTSSEKKAATDAFLRDVVRRLPTVMFLMLPLYAFLLKLLYIRRDWYYTEHLVFGLHMHAFIFLVFTVISLITFIGEDTWMEAISAILALVCTPVYAFIAQKRVYEQGWFKTVVKSFVLGTAYSFVLAVGLIVTLIVATAF